jgi:hypothetical protein
MDHNQAVEIQAVERYLLGDLDPGERDSFEEHYFTCPVCAGEVRSAARFRANAREVLKELARQPDKVPGRGWFSWSSLVPMAATVLSLGVVAYQSAIVIPSLRAPKSLSLPLTLDGVTRGSLPQIEQGKSLEILMAAPATDSLVISELTTESDKVITRGTTEKPVPNQPYRVFFPGEYGPGRYIVILRDAATGKELERNKFEIVAKESPTR